jgi:hypothetical protein
MAGLLGKTCTRGGVTDLQSNLQRNGASPTGTSVTHG